VLIEESGLDTGGMFNNFLNAKLLQCVTGTRRDCNPSLAGKRFPWDPNRNSH
jgi:hypothetical protein